MCKLGDIIVVKEFKNENDKTIPKHSFAVINDEEDFVDICRKNAGSNNMDAELLDKLVQLILILNEKGLLKKGSTNLKN